MDEIFEIEKNCSKTKADCQKTKENEGGLTEQEAENAANEVDRKLKNGKDTVTCKQWLTGSFI